MNPVYIMLVLGAGLAGAWLLLRWRGQRPKEEPYYHVLCPNCKKRLRFRARQSGKGSRCPRCNKDLILPPLSEAID